MLTKINSCAVIGLDGRPINIEIDVNTGWPQLVMVGLADKAIDESRQRIPTAIKNSGFDFPATKKVVVNLAPADLKKEGAAFDLAIAIGILLASKGDILNLDDSIFIGELALDGTLRPTKGVLPISIWAKEKGIKKVYIPKVNCAEAGIISNIEIIPVINLKELYFHLKKKEQISPYIHTNTDKNKESFIKTVDMSDISGQENAKRALEIAAAGAHNVLLSGPPGSGKTLLSNAMSSILPSMSLEEKLEITKIYSIAGRLSPQTPLIEYRPFRSPHHTSSGVALVGGGTFPSPGEISLAHRGVLFLDEFPEFSRQVLENLRQPLEDGMVTISRAQGSLTFPARFILIASQNPCPCGYVNDNEKECICTPSQILKYQSKISGPILDRIDLHVEVPRLDFDKLHKEQRAESSDTIQQRVEKARGTQFKRMEIYKKITNSEMTPQLVKEMCVLDTETRDLIKKAVNTLHMSARSFHRILKVARTIADLAESENIKSSHVAEALQYRPASD